jgi:predicted Zn-dependent peptidase
MPFNESLWTAPPQLAFLPSHRALARLWLCGILLMVLLVAAMAPARADRQAVFIAPLDTPGMITLYVFIPYEAETPGLAHYAEHLAWLSAIGGSVRLGDPHSNASTSPRSVVYHMSGPRAEINTMLETLARVFQPINLTQDFAIEERGIVEREYDLRLAGKPVERAFEQMNPFLYEGNPTAISVMGTPAEIRALGFEDAKSFHQATHRPERAMLMAEGDITEEQLLTALAATKFPPLAPLSAVTPSPLKLAPPAEKVFREADEKAIPRMLWSKLVELPEPVPFEQLVIQSQLLGDILTTALAGGLAKPLRYDSFTARAFEVDVTAHDERHVEFYVSAEPDSGIGFAALRQAVENALAQSAQGIPAATYERVVKRFRAAMPDPADRPASLRRMSDDMYGRLLDQRVMVDEQALRAIVDQLDHRAIDSLVAAVNAPGRVAVVFIGKDPAP